jgi:outer membrane lipoprotein LolB
VKRAARLGAPALTLAAALFVGGCATRQPAPAEAGWTSGRLSVQVAAHEESPARSLSASFDLRGNGERGELRLSTPLGTQLAAARWSPGEAWLATPTGQTHYADLEALSRAVLGEALPLQALPDWLAARPWPGAAWRPLVSGFEQLGWRVDVAGFADGRVDAVRDTPPAVLLRARIDPPAEELRGSIDAPAAELRSRIDAPA